jgi:TIR domain-containing protein
MSDIFLSYASSDREAAGALAHRLEREGWSVWWDRQIPPGKAYDDVIEQALLTAKCIVVLWSKASTTSDWVRSEAEEGKQRGILVPALIEESRIPLAFRRIQAADIIGWQTSEQTTEFDQFLHAIHMTLEDIGLHAESSHSDADELTDSSNVASGRVDLSASAAHTSSPEDNLTAFLTRTYNAWSSGKLSGLSDTYEKSAQSASKEAVISEFLKEFGHLLRAVLSITNFSEDEFLVGVPGSELTPSFVLTNRVLYLFLENSVSGPITPIPLRNISNYKTVDGFWTSRIELSLKNGETRVIKGITSVPKDPCVNYLIYNQ